MHIDTTTSRKSAARTTVPSKLLLDGLWIDSATSMTVRSPWTGELVAEVAEASAEQARAAGDAARKALPAMRALSGHQRSEALRLIAAGIASRADTFASLIRDQAGKPMGLARAEVQRAVKTFTLGAEEALRLPGEIVYPDQEAHGAGMVGRVQYFPLGAILGITPFNFPLNLIAHKVSPGLAAGCPIVIKPPPQAPGAALLLGEIVLQSGLPPAALQILPGGLEAGQALCASAAFAAVSFTGSARAGWSIKKNALPHQKVLLEMGGNAALIVDESADLDAVARAVASAGYAYAGQICIKTQRIIAHKSIASTFERKLVERIAADVSVSDNPADEKTVVGPLIDKSAADRVESWVNAALKRGAIPVVKGERRGERLISPWLLKNVPADEPVSCEEVFGPVVVIQEAADIGGAIALANASRYGLQASVFTDSLRNAERCYRELDAGAVLVNVPTTFRIDAALYGGVKESGFGREGVREVVRAFSEPKLMVAKA